MSKKITLAALMAVVAVVLAVPAMASALVALHVNPKPAATTAITGGATSLSDLNGNTVKCSSVTSTGTGATWTSTTGGTLTLTFSGCTDGSGFFKCGNEATEKIVTTALSFQLVTLSDEKPGVLIRPASGEHFATFECAGFLNFAVNGNGILGEIENACGAKVTKTSIKYEISKHGEQAYKLLKNTTTQYDLKANGVTAAEKGTGEINFNGTSTELVCT
jgi:hypothetical protein